MPNSQNAVFHGQGIATLQIKEGVKYFEENKDTLIPVYLPTTASPESL